MSNKNNTEFKQHLEEKLKAINSDYTYNINWYIDIEKKRVTEKGYQIDVSSKEIFIVITPMPSRSYGDSCIEQQLEITAYCDLRDASAAMDILSDYQNAAVNKKWWSDTGTLVNESWYSPSIQDMSANFKVHKGCIIGMNGSVTFTENVVDIEKVYLCGEWNKLFQFYSSTTGDTIPSQETGSPRKKGITRGIIGKIDLKCKSTNSIFCQTVREWTETNSDSEKGVNVEIPVKLVYTDSHEKEYTMIINSAVLTTTDGTIPTWSVSLMEKQELEE